MTRNPDLKGIIGIASTTCPGIAQAVEASGKTGSVVATGYCSPNTVRDYVKSGAMTYSVLWNPSDLGYLTVWAAKELSEGRTFADTVTVDGLKNQPTWLAEDKILLLGPPMVFTAENIDQFKF
jgi:ABC-type sugar transport system substrate-binding protein